LPASSREGGSTTGAGRSAAGPASSNGRRTQAERRAATRAALLAAALDCLVEEGYANLTTRKVAERAGVSQGTQMHYFPTREQFVAEAIRHVAGELIRELHEQIPPAASDPRERVEAVLDLLWGVHTGPIFQASMELWVASRTDPELRESMGELTREVNRMILDSTNELFPDFASRRRSREILDLTLATMRGLAMLAGSVRPADVDRTWRASRRQLLDMHLDSIGEAA
jgi:AcrR family transcriptional regulator